MRQRLAMWAMWPPVAVCAALATLAAWSFHERWALLSESPFPLGVDGYFYPVQLRSLLTHGELAYASSPVSFYLLAPFAAATDPITGAKLGAAFWGAAIAFPAYGVGARLGGSRGAGLVAAALATTSVGSTYLTIEFVKNSIGLTVALTALWLVLGCADRPSRTRFAAAIAGIAAAWASHKMAAAIVGIVAVPVGLAAATRRGALRGRRLLLAIGALIALAGAALVIGAAAPRRFVSAGDAQLVRDLWSTTPYWSAPALILPGGARALGHDALLGIGLGLLVGIARLVRTARWMPVRRAGDAVSAPAPRVPTAPATTVAAAWPIVVLAIAIGLPLLDVTDREGLGMRLRLAAFVPAALVAAIAARGVLARYAHREAVLVALALVLAVVRQPGAELGSAVVTHPALVTAVQALNGHVPGGATLIVPERHIAFMVAWYTGGKVALRPDGIPRDQRIRVLPLHTIVAGSALDHELMAARAQPQLPPPIGVHPRHPNGLVLVAEPTWEWILARLPASDRDRFAAWPTI